MKIEYFTSGDGPLYGPLAECLIKRTRLFGIDVKNLVPGADLRGRGYWIKCLIWQQASHDADFVVWFDADILPINLPDFTTFNGGWSARIDDESVGLGERQTHSRFHSIANYYNVGFFAADRSAQAILEKAYHERDNRIHGNCVEQTWINYYLNQSGIPQNIISPEICYFRRAELVPKVEYLRHYANYRGRDKLIMLKEANEIASVPLPNNNS